MNKTINKNDIPVVILAGGKGTRISEKTNIIPKPLIKIRQIPIIFHIMTIFAFYGYKNFIIASGYKSILLKNYFNNKLNLTKSLYKKKYKIINKFPNIFNDWEINIQNTGIETLTGGRILRLKNFIKNRKLFFLTYGDGLANVNIEELLKKHLVNKKNPIITLSAVRPPARYGSLKFKNNNQIHNFKEKDRMNEGWINGGFMVCNSSILNLIKDDRTILEKNILEKASKKGLLFAYKHDNYWQSMDTMRDYRILQEHSKKNKLPWLF